MSQPDAVTLWRTHEMVVPSDEAIGRAEWHEERVADETYAYPDAEYRALPAAAYAALLTRVEAAEGALAFYARRDVWTHGEDMDGNTWAYADGGERARLALRASGTREGE